MGSRKVPSGREAEGSQGLRKFRELNPKWDEGLLGCGPKRLRLKRLCRLSLLRNSGPAAPGALMSPVGPIVRLRLAQGGVAFIVGGGTDFHRAYSLLSPTVFEGPTSWLVLPLFLHSVSVWPGGPWWWLGSCVPTFRQVRGIGSR